MHLDVGIGVGTLARVVMVGLSVSPMPSTATAQTDRLAGLFEDGLISQAERGEAFPSLSPDGAELYFSIHDEGWSFHTLYVSEWNHGWTEPTVLPFSGRYSDRAPRLAPDGRSLFFSSNRPLEGHRRGDWNLWVVERDPEGEWGDPVPLPESVNSAANEYHAAPTGDGRLFFARVTDSRTDEHDIFMARQGPNGQYGPARNVGPPISDEYSQPDLWVSPGGDLMILVITDRPDGFGGDDLYVSYREGDRWTEPVNLGPKVNTERYEYGPALSPDGQLFFFTGHARGPGDIYSVPATALPIRTGLSERIRVML